ncbi:hypothetical protein SGRIM119S_03280 [Streptomyces griseorubiginosus]
MADPRGLHPTATGPATRRRPAPPMGEARLLTEADPGTSPPRLSGTCAPWPSARPEHRNPTRPGPGRPPGRKNSAPPRATTSTHTHKTDNAASRNGSSWPLRDLAAQVIDKAGNTQGGGLCRGDPGERFGHRSDSPSVPSVFPRLHRQGGNSEAAARTRASEPAVCRPLTPEEAMTPTPHLTETTARPERLAPFQQVERSFHAQAGTATVDIVVPVYNEERALPGCLCAHSTPDWRRTSPFHGDHGRRQRQHRRRPCHRWSPRQRTAGVEVPSTSTARAAGSPCAPSGAPATLTSSRTWTWTCPPASTGCSRWSRPWPAVTRTSPSGPGWHLGRARCAARAASSSPAATTASSGSRTAPGSPTPSADSRRPAPRCCGRCCR